MAKMIKSSETTVTKTLLLKKSQEIEISNHRVRGVCTIKTYRKYQFHYEVDVVFKGEIYGTFDSILDWWDSSILQKRTRTNLKASPTRINKSIRKGLFLDLQPYLKYFNIDLFEYTEIKKVNWL